MTKVIYEYKNAKEFRIVGWRGEKWEVRIPWKFLPEFSE